MTKLSSIQKIGFGIAFLSLLWLLSAWNENSATLEEMTTMEGKITDIEFQRVGKYANDTALYCTLDNGRKFYANNRLNDLNQLEFSDVLRKSEKVKLWFNKDLTRYANIVPSQLTVDGVMYVDFSKTHSILPDYFWYVIAALIFGIVLIMEKAIRNILLR